MFVNLLVLVDQSLDETRLPCSVQSSPDVPLSYLNEHIPPAGSLFGASYDVISN